MYGSDLAIPPFMPFPLSSFLLDPLPRYCPLLVRPHLIDTHAHTPIHTHMHTLHMHILREQCCREIQSSTPGP